MGKKKTGKLSLHDMAYIRANCRIKSLEEIAEALNRTTEPVKKFIYENNLLDTDVLDEEGVRKSLYARLKTRSYWKETKRQLEPEELSYFTEMWIDLMLQFNEDVLASEELQIKQWIILDILTNRSMYERKKHIDDMQRLQDAMDKEYRKPRERRDIELLRNLQDQLVFARGAVSTFTTEHTKLSQDMQRLSKNMKATRDQRLQKIEDSETTFLGILRMLEDERIRKVEGESMELMKLAQNKSKEDLSEYHTYTDGEVDKPVLTSETISDEGN